MKTHRKVLIGVLPLALLLGCAGMGILYLRSANFQEFARSALISRIQRSTGLECRIQALRLNVFRGNFVITGFALSPRTAAPGLVNLETREIRASLSISSFWHLRVRLGELIVVKPRLELISGGGESSWTPEDILENLKISLRLEAARVTVQDGWLKLNSHTAPLHLSLDDLDCEIRYDKKLPSYRVRLEYGRSRVIWEKRDILHGLQVNADISQQGMSIESFQFRRGNTLFRGSGSLNNWKTPVFLLHAAGTFDARDLVLAAPSLYEGRGRFDVVADFRYGKDGIYSKGTFTARAGSYRKMNYNTLAGSYEIRQDVLYLSNVTGRIAEGKFLVNAEIQLREANRDPNRVVAAATNVPVIEAGRLLNLPLLNFENTADSNTILTWYGGKELRADCTAALHGMARAAGSGKSTLLDGSARFTYFDSGTVYLESADLNSPYTSVQASGGPGSLFHVQLSTNHISEPFDLIAGFSPPVADLLNREPDLRGIAGDFGFNGDVRIKSSTDVQYSGSISLKNGHWRTYKVDALSTQAVFIPPRLSLNSLKLQSGRQALEGDLDLELSEEERVSRFGFKGKVDGLSLASLKDFGFDSLKLAGSLSGSGSVKLERGLWQGEGEFSIEDGKYDGERFENLHARLLLSDQRLRIVKAEARRGSARIYADGQVILDSGELSLKTRLLGIPLDEIPMTQKKGLPVRGRIDASGELKGTMKNPAFSGGFELKELRYGSWSFGNGKGRIEFQNKSVRGNAQIESDIGILRLDANIATTAGYPGKTSLEFENLDIQKVIAARPPAYLQNLSTALQGKLEVEGNFDVLDSLRIRGEVDGAHFKIHDYELRNAGRMRFTIASHNFRMESVRFVGNGTNLFLNGTIPLNESSQLDLNLSGSLNLQLLEGIEKKLHTSGAATLNIRATGSRRDPQVIGQASFQDAKLDYTEDPLLRFSGMQGDIVFSRNLVRFENVRGAFASGAIQVSGIIEHQNAVLRSINIGISLRNARMPFPKDFKSVANAELVLSGSGDVQILSGDVDVTRMEYVRSFNLLEQLASHGGTQSGPLTTEPYLLGLRLNVEIHSDNGLSIDNELTRLRGSMRLTLRGTPAYPYLTGRVEAKEGTIFFRGSRFEISHASADFIDRNRINPVLEIRAEADVKTYRLILDAAGDLEHLNLNVTSDPPMSTVDILSLLTTGKTEQGNGTSQRESQMAGMSAASVLSENLTGVIGKRVQRIFGLESFRVDPFLAGAENDPTARITISERLSKDLVVTFSRNLTTNQEQIVVIEYDVGKNVSVVATRDEDGKFGLDFRLRKRLR